MPYANEYFLNVGTVYYNTPDPTYSGPSSQYTAQFGGFSSVGTPKVVGLGVTIANTYPPPNDLAVTSWGGNPLSFWSGTITVLFGLEGSFPTTATCQNMTALTMFCVYNATTFTSSCFEGCTSLVTWGNVSYTYPNPPGPFGYYHNGGTTYGANCFKNSGVKYFYTVTTGGSNLPDIFSGCPLETFTAPNLTSVTASIFTTNTNLNTFYAPLLNTISVTGLFQNKAKLIWNNTQLNLGVITSIPASTFQSALTTTASQTADLSVVSTQPITTVGNSAFQSSGIGSFIGNSVTTLGNSVFQSCTNLTSVTIPVATTIGNSVLNSCTSITTFIANSITTTGTAVFQDCTALQAVRLLGLKDATNVCTLKDNLLNGCSALKYLYLLYPPTTIGTTVFTSVPSTARIVYPQTTSYSWSASYTSGATVSTYALPPPTITSGITISSGTVTMTGVNRSIYPSESITTTGSTFTWKNNGRQVQSSTSPYTTRASSAITITITSPDMYGQIGTGSYNITGGSTFTKILLA